MDTYFTTIENNAAIRIKTFLPLIKAVKAGGKVTYKKRVEVAGRDYLLKLAPLVEMDESGNITLTLLWKDGEEENFQTIAIKREESHLISGSYVYYFLTGELKSKKLFYIGNKFRSRQTFKHLYRTQRKSEGRRIFAHLSADEPYRRNGKELYRGNITPYGKRCEKYELNKLKGMVRAYKVLGMVDKQIYKKVEENLKLLEKMS